MKSNEEEITRTNTKQYVKELYGLLMKRPDQSAELLNITDVLLQVYKKIDQAKNPEALVNRLINYIRILASKGRIHFPAPQEDLIIKLGAIGQKAGLNGLYMADFSDKSQFYSPLEKMPRRE